MGTIGFGLEAQTSSKTDGKAQQTRTEAIRGGGKNVIITKRTGMATIEKAYESLRQGGDTLDAAIMVGKAQEDDPNDDTVGLGGLPNEDGVVELDSCCMHGPTRRAGAVGGVRGIKNVSLLAKAVMEHTGHVMLVAEGAEKFAKAMGFAQENLLTEEARKKWLLWKETSSDQDWWGPSLADPNYQVPKGTQPPSNISELREERMRWMEEKAAEIGIPPEQRALAIDRVLHPSTGTILCFGAERERRNVRHDHDIRTGVETRRPAWRFTDHWSGLLHGPGSRLSGRYGQRRREHQGGRCAFDCGEHAQRDVAERSRAGRAKTHRACVREDAGEIAIHQHDVLHSAERWRVRGCLAVERS
jgi:hypothetical protein